MGSKREIDDKLLDKPVVYLLTRRPWSFLMKYEVTEIMVDWVRELYNNMDIVSTSEVKTYVTGNWFTITPDELGEFLDILMLSKFDYLVSSNTLRTPLIMMKWPQHFVAKRLFELNEFSLMVA